MKVLIVDDDKLARQGLIAVMNWEKYGFEVAGDVQNGKKALEFLEKHPVDIVFTDIDMPEMDGFQLMQQCQKKHPSVSFVIFSVYENFRYAQAAIRMGALDYISKISFEPDECEQVLGQIRAKFEKTGRQAREEDDRDLKALEDGWMSLSWIFDERRLEGLCKDTAAAGARSAERIFIKSFHNLQMMMGKEENEFPSLDSVGEMLAWVKEWREKVYERCERGKYENDIYSFAFVAAYVRMHVCETLKLEDAARQIGMSRSYFSAKFKEMTGETFHNFVIRQKMQEAARRIAGGKQTVTQAASDLGYDNFHYFAKVFAKEYGCMPSDYRNSVKNCPI